MGKGTSEIRSLVPFDVSLSTFRRKSFWKGGGSTHERREGWFSALTVRCGRLKGSQPNDGKMLGMVGAAAYDAALGSRTTKHHHSLSEYKFPHILMTFDS